MHALELHDVVWECGGRHKLDNGPVRIARGTVAVVVAGPTVASALADVVCGLTRPVEGHVVVEGLEVTGGPPAPDQIALVPPGGGLLPHLTVEKNIEFNLDPRGSSRARADQLAELAKDLQLVGALSRSPHSLTAEQRLRVAVARALARRPSTLVVEDRTDEVSCAAAVRAATAQGVAVLVITDSPLNAAVLTSRVHTARPLPAGPAAAAEPPPDAARQPVQEPDREAARHAVANGEATGEPATERPEP